MVNGLCNILLDRLDFLHLGVEHEIAMLVSSVLMNRKNVCLLICSTIVLDKVFLFIGFAECLSALQVVVSEHVRFERCDFHPRESPRVDHKSPSYYFFFKRMLQDRNFFLEENCKKKHN